MTGGPGLLTARLAALFVAALFVFDPPGLALAHGRAWPVFAAWAVLIGVLAWWMERDG